MKFHHPRAVVMNREPPEQPAPVRIGLLSMVLVLIGVLVACQDPGTAGRQDDGGDREPGDSVVSGSGDAIGSGDPIGRGDHADVGDPASGDPASGDPGGADDEFTLVHTIPRVFSGDDELSSAAIIEVTSTGTFVGTLAEFAGVPGVVGLAMAPGGELYFGLARTGPYRVELMRWTRNGGVHSLGDIIDTSGAFIQAAFLDVDFAVGGDGLVYFSTPEIIDIDDAVVRPAGISRAGDGVAPEVVLTVADGEGVNGLAFDNAGELYYGRVYHGPSADAPYTVDLMRWEPGADDVSLATVVDTTGVIIDGIAFDFELAADMAGVLYYTVPATSVDPGGEGWLTSPGVRSLEPASGTSRDIVSAVGPVGSGIAGLVVQGDEVWFGLVSPPRYEPATPFTVELAHATALGGPASLGVMVDTSSGRVSGLGNDFELVLTRRP